jgi:hypothetical protein
MEAEYIALSKSMRDLIPVREVLKEIMGIVFQREPTITQHSHAKAFADTDVGTIKYTIPQSTVFEDNDACLKFARMPKLTPRTKHIGVPYHWFRSQVERIEIHIEPIDTTKQLGDQYTKGLSTDLFRASHNIDLNSFSFHIDISLIIVLLTRQPDRFITQKKQLVVLSSLWSHFQKAPGSCANPTKQSCQTINRIKSSTW